jgi:hypothetical protein
LRPRRPSGSSLLALVLAGIAVVAAASAARAEDPVVTQARAAYGFAAWPGRTVASRDGIDLAAIALPGLPRASLDLRAAPGGPVARIGFGGSMRATIHVEATPAAAQEALLQEIAACSRPLERLAGKRARGDVAFGASGPSGELLAFASANICAVVHGPSRFVAAIADRIEALVLASPEIDGRDDRTVATVRSIGPAPGTSDARAHAVGVAVDIAGACAHREAHAASGAIVEDTGGGLVLRASASGPVEITVELLSPRGWRTRKSAIVDAP